MLRKLLLGLIGAALAASTAFAQVGGGVTSPAPTLSSLGAAPTASPTFTGTVTSSGAVALTALSETYTAPTISGGTLTINLALGTVFNVANTANITAFTISNATASKASSFTLILTANGTGYTQAWGASVKWAGGSAPTLTTTNAKVDVLTFVTNDGGTTWYAFVGGQNF